jgi:hypothetical protein
MFITAPLKRGHFSHYFVGNNGRTEMFNVETCENCGTMVMCPNSVGGSQSDISKYKSLGMKRLKELPPETYYSEELDGCACYDCNG